MNHTWGNRKKQSCPFILFFQYPTDKLKSHIIQVLHKASYVNTIPTLVRWKSYSRSELYFLISLRTIWRTQVYIYRLCHAICGILVPNQGLNLHFLHWKYKVITTGPPGKPQELVLKTYSATYLQRFLI